MLQNLREKNPGLVVEDIRCDEFRTYGRVVSDFNAAPLLAAAKTIAMPTEGVKYVADEEKFTKLPEAAQLENACFGQLPCQIGFCWGHNHALNGAEWHTVNELNIAVTPLAVLLAHTYEMEDGKIAGARFRAFYVPAGTVFEMFTTSLHFCPCQVQDGGFADIVCLPKGVNTEAPRPGAKNLRRINKWFVCHEKNAEMIAAGSVIGITGVNPEVKY